MSSSWVARYDKLELHLVPRRHVANKRKAARLTFPHAFDDRHLRVHHVLPGPDQLDLCDVPGHHGEPDLLADQVVPGPPQHGSCS